MGKGTRNQFVGKTARGFESHRLRQKTNLIRQSEVCSFMVGGIRSLRGFRRKEHMPVACF